MELTTFQNLSKAVTMHLVSYLQSIRMKVVQDPNITSHLLNNVSIGEQ